MIRVVRGVGVLLVLLLFAASCAAGTRPIVVEEGSPEYLAYVAEADDPVAGGVLRAALLRPNTVDPAAISLAHSGAVILADLLFDGLTQITANGEVVSGLASGWDPSEDFEVWTFTLEAEASFHDGRPVTADDVVASLLRLGSSGSAAASTLDGLAFEAVDEVTIRVTAGSPNTLIPVMLSGVAYGIVPPDFDESTLVGSGPFRAVAIDGPRWRLDGVVGRTWLEGMEAVLVDDLDTAFELFVSDNLDLALVPGGAAAQAFEAGVVHQRAASTLVYAAEGEGLAVEDLSAGMRPWASLIPRALAGEVPCSDCETPASAVVASEQWVAPYASPAALFDGMVLAADGPLAALLEEARGEPDPVARTALFAEADKLAQASGLAQPVADGLHTVVVSERVRDLAVRADGSIETTSVWMGI